MRTETGTLIEALKILSEEIQSVDGVANAAILEGANRLEELSSELKAIKANMGILEIYHKGINQIKADAILRAAMELGLYNVHCDMSGVDIGDTLAEYANSLINKEG